MGATIDVRCKPESVRIGRPGSRPFGRGGIAHLQPVRPAVPLYQAMKNPCLILFLCWMNLLFPLLALWGIKNGLSSIEADTGGG